MSRVHLAAGAALASILAASPGAAAPARGCGVAITGVTVIDGKGSAPAPNRTVVARDGKISAVGPAASTSVPGCAQRIDGRGKYLTPGFIDTNLHVAMPGPNFEFARYWDRLEDMAIEGAQLQLKYGFTSIRDSYGVLKPLLAARDAINRGQKQGARLFVAGNIVGWGGTFSKSFRGKPADNYFEEWINDEMAQGSGELLAWKSPDELRVAISKYMDLGIDFVKIGTTVHDHNSPELLFTPRQMKALVEEIHKRGKVAEVHATSNEGMVVAMDAGADLIQHPEVMGVPISDEVLSMLDQRKAICSVHGNNHTGRAWAMFERERAAKKAAKGDDEPSVTEQRNWKKPGKTERQIQQQMIDDNPAVLRANAQKIVKTRCIVTTATDNSLGRAPEFDRNPNAWRAREPGLGSLASIEALVELGMTPAQAITAATLNGAIALKMEDRLGTIETGKIADMVLLDADPLADIHNVRRIAEVFKDGRRIDRARLPEKPVIYRPQ